MYRLSLVVCLTTLCSQVWAQNYAYVSRGESGEVSFSDEASPNATKIELPQFVDTPTSSADQVALMLDVAGELRTARLAREKAREPAQQPAPTPVTRVIERQTGGFFPGFGFNRFNRFNRQAFHPGPRSFHPRGTPNRARGAKGSSRPIHRSKFRPRLN